MLSSLAGTRVLVGLSGGVDSAVSAYLLKRAGADVTGVFVKGWYPEGMPCTWREDRKDALRVAAHLGIPFTTLDASEAYKAGVIDYLLREYKAGRTPNPDVMCNREVKFGALDAYRRKEGFQYLATGHYARRNEAGVLMKGLDETKDQSYFLWAVPKDTLTETLFPVGNIKKTETREHARKAKLPVSLKKDSQGICFLGSVSVSDFLRKEFGTEQGVLRTRDGKEVGTHDGVLLYTLGQRITVPKSNEPYYVVAKEIEENTLIVDTTPKPAETEVVRFSEANWFMETPSETIVEAQGRYHGPFVSGQLTQSGVFTPTDEIREPYTSGQSIVFYQGENVIGGGIIE